MNYCCENCGFLFQRMGEVQECPLCERSHFRPATAEEMKRLQAFLNKELEMRKGERT